MTERSKEKLDLHAIRKRLEDGNAPEMWRSLDELAGTQEVKDYQDHEFPYRDEKTRVSRRDVLKLMSASAAMAGLSACTKLPTEKIVPYVQAPEEFIPGKPLFYATSMPFGGVANGLLVESHMGRPTKAEGNPQHPASLGSADIFMQSSVLTLYDPDRSQTVVHIGRIGSWSEFLDAMASLRMTLAATEGQGFRILTETVTSPSLAAQISELLKQFPQAKWHQYEPAGRDNARRRQAGVRRIHRDAIQVRSRGRDSFARLGFSLFRAGSGAVCAGFCRQAAGYGGYKRDEPLVRG